MLRRASIRPSNLARADKKLRKILDVPKESTTPVTLFSHVYRRRAQHSSVSDYFSHARISFIAMRTNNWLTNNAEGPSTLQSLRGCDRLLSTFSYAVATMRINYRPFATHEPEFPASRWASLFYPRGDLSAITTPRVSPRDLFCERWRKEGALSQCSFLPLVYASYCAMRSDESRINDRRSFATIRARACVCARVQERVRSLLSQYTRHKMPSVIFIPLPNESSLNEEIVISRFESPWKYIFDVPSPAIRQFATLPQIYQVELKVLDMINDLWYCVYETFSWKNLSHVWRFNIWHIFACNFFF